jgi:hypothetical protein
MKRRNLILLLGGTGSAALSTGTGAFSSMEAERGVEVNVVDDDVAYVGYSESDKTIPSNLKNDGSLHLVTITNRFSEEIRITDVSIDDDDTGVVADVSYDPVIETGHAEDIVGHVEGLAPDDSVDVEITVTVEGTGVTAQLFGDTETRRFTIERSDQDVGPVDSEVEYFGNGNAEILRDNENLTVDVYLFDKNPGQGDKIVTKNVEIDTDKNLRSQLSGAGGDRIIGVTLNGTTYVHPQWNSGTCSFEESNNGGFGVPSDSDPSCGSE